MTIENATVISEFDPNNPPGSDPVSEGDDQLRQLKDVLLHVFPGNTAPGVFDVDWNITPFGYYGGFLSLTGDIIMDTGYIYGNPQVSMGLASIDGATGGFDGPNQGIDAATKEGVGQYDLQLVETGWAQLDDLQLCGSVNTAANTFGGMIIHAPFGAGHTTEQGWVGIETYEVDGQETVADAGIFRVVFFDAGRDLP